MDYGSVIYGALGHLLNAGGVFLVFWFAKVGAEVNYPKQKTLLFNLPKSTIIYGAAVFGSALIALFMYASNDSVYECDDPLYGSCVMVEGTDMTSIERKEKSSEIFVWTLISSLIGVCAGIGEVESTSHKDKQLVRKGKKFYWM